LPQIETGVVYKPSDKKMVITRRKTVDGLPLEAGEYPDIDDVSIYIDNEDFQTLSVFAHYNKYVEGKRHEWWKNLGIRFRSKGYKAEHVQPIFDYAVEYVQLGENGDFEDIRMRVTNGNEDLPIIVTGITADKAEITSDSILEKQPS
jgi:hypothetical protein